MAAGTASRKQSVLGVSQITETIRFRPATSFGRMDVSSSGTDDRGVDTMCSSPEPNLRPSLAESIVSHRTIAVAAPPATIHTGR